MRNLLIFRENLLWKCDSVSRSPGKYRPQSSSQMVSGGHFNYDDNYLN